MDGNSKKSKNINQTLKIWWEITLAKSSKKHLWKSSILVMLEKQNPSKVFFKDFAYSGAPTLTFYV